MSGAKKSTKPNVLIFLTFMNEINFDKVLIIIQTHAKYFNRDFDDNADLFLKNKV